MVGNGEKATREKVVVKLMENQRGISSEFVVRARHSRFRERNKSKLRTCRR